MHVQQNVKNISVKDSMNDFKLFYHNTFCKTDDFKSFCTNTIIQLDKYRDKNNAP